MTAPVPLHLTGVTTYVADRWSPVDAEANGMGDGEEDFDLEGRSAP